MTVSLELRAPLPKSMGEIKRDLSSLLRPRVIKLVGSYCLKNSLTIPPNAVSFIQNP